MERLIVPKSNQLNTDTSFSLSDAYDISSLAASDLKWMNVALSDIRARISKLKKDLTERDSNNQYDFYVIEKMLCMYEYLAEERLHHHEQESERLKALFWQANKGGEA